MDGQEVVGRLNALRSLRFLHAVTQRCGNTPSQLRDRLNIMMLMSTQGPLKSPGRFCRHVRRPRRAVFSCYGDTSRVERWCACWKIGVRPSRASSSTIRVGNSNQPRSRLSSKPSVCRLGAVASAQVGQDSDLAKAASQSSAARLGSSGCVADSGPLSRPNKFFCVCSHSQRFWSCGR